MIRSLVVLFATLFKDPRPYPVVLHERPTLPRTRAGKSGVAAMRRAARKRKRRARHA